MFVGAIGIEATRPLGQLPRQPVPSKLHEVDGGCGCACESSRRGRQGDRASRENKRLECSRFVAGCERLARRSSLRGSGQLEEMRRREGWEWKGCEHGCASSLVGLPGTRVPSMVLHSTAFWAFLHGYD
jgi:hypothetical protein